MQTNNHNHNHKDIIICTYNYKLIINKNYLEILKNIKVLNEKSIFLTGIPIELEINDLMNYKYWGQYGKIVNIIKSKVKKKIKLKTYSIFVTFENKISCALAIKSMDNFKFENKVMKCSYASNKICTEKIMNGICEKKDCYFFHGKINNKNSIIKMLNNTNLKIIEFFSKKSSKILKKNIKKVIDKFYKINSKQTIFPSVNLFLLKFFNKDKIRKNLSTDVESKKKIDNFLISFKKLNN